MPFYSPSLCCLHYNSQRSLVTQRSPHCQVFASSLRKGGKLKYSAHPWLSLLPSSHLHSKRFYLQLATTSCVQKAFSLETPVGRHAPHPQNLMQKAHICIFCLSGKSACKDFGLLKCAQAFHSSLQLSIQGCQHILVCLDVKQTHSAIGPGNVLKYKQH